MSEPPRLVLGYRKAGSLFLTLSLLFVLLNLGVAAAHYLGSRLRVAGPVQKYGIELMQEVHSEIAPEDLGPFLTESYQRGFRYAPLLSFREVPFEGRWVNVEEAGYRHGAEPLPWPPEPEYHNIFVLGGSTTFGYGVPDQHTIPAYLQMELEQRRPQLKARVYNFGQGSYFSTMERVFFEQLLLEQFVPDTVVMVDGLNDFHWYDGVPPYSPAMADLFERARGAQAYHDYSWSWLPVVRVGQEFLAALNPPPPPDLPPFDDEEVLEGIWQRYLANTKMVKALAESHGAGAVFVFQPVPTYNYDLAHHAMVDSDDFDFGQHNFSKSGYPKIKERFIAQGDHYLWCADLQQDQQRNLYVDEVHYNVEFSKIIAAEIARQMLERGLLTPEETGAATAPAGSQKM